MGDSLGMHAFQEAKVINMVGDVRKQFRYVLPALTMLIKPPEWFHQLALTLLTKRTKADAGEVDRFIVVIDEIRFVVETVDVAGPTLHENKDDSFGTLRQHRQ